MCVHAKRTNELWHEISSSRNTGAMQHVGIAEITDTTAANIVC